MRKMDRKVLLTLGVLAALSISGGAIYAYSTHSSGVKIDGFGIGMDTAPTNDERQIVWPDDQEIVAGYSSPDVYWKASVTADNVNRNAISSLFAFNDYNGSTHDERAWVEAGPNGTAIGSSVRDGTFQLVSEVRADYDSNASMWSDSGAQVEVQSDGDVVITLGN